MMRVCIFGAGSIGGLVAGMLARAGRDVCLIGRGPHLRAIQASGLRIRLPTEEFTTHPVATDDPATLGPQDLVIVATKTTALCQVAEAIGPLLHDVTQVAFAINGVFWFYAHGLPDAPNVARLDPGGVLASRIGASRALGIIVRASAEVVEPGLVVSGGSRRHLLVGDATPGPADRARAAAMALACPDLGVEAVDDLRRAMWAKLALNVGSSPLACLTAADARTVWEVPALRGMSQLLRQETLAVAAAVGCDGLPLAPTGSPPAPIKPSMLQDLERGRPMEVETQLAIVQDLARQRGVATPVLDILLPLLVLRAQMAGSPTPGVEARP